MSDLLLDTQSPPATPAAGQGVAYFDSVSGLWTTRDPNGRSNSLVGALRNWNTSDVTANGADTYLTGSRLDVPGHGLQAGVTFTWVLSWTKTAAGVGSPIWSIRVGTAGTTADSARLQFTSPVAQTAVADTGRAIVRAVLRSVGGGTSAVIAGCLDMTHANQTTGLATVQQVLISNTGAGWDSTVANLKVGLSVNPGASALWTHQLVSAEAANL